MRLAMVPTARRSKAAPPPRRERLCRQPSMWIARPGHAGQPGPVDADGPAAPTRHAAGLGLLHPPDLLSREQRLERAARRPGIAMAGAAVRAQPGERVQRRSATIWAPKYRQATFGAFLTDAGRMRSRRSTSPIATCSRPSSVPAPGAEGPADHPRRPQPGQPAPDCACSRERIAGTARGGADRRRLCGRLADLDDRRPAGARPAGLRAARPGGLRPVAGRASASRPIPSMVDRHLRRDRGPERRAAGGIADAVHQPADRQRRRRGARGGQSRHARSPTRT